MKKVNLCIVFTNKMIEFKWEKDIYNAKNIFFLVSDYSEIKKQLVFNYIPDCKN